jgi:carbon monoxide dehydrogenase subunit G
MEMRGSREIAAPRAQVWEALIDPQVLRACVPGCESMTGSVRAGFEARVRQRIGPVGASFEGRVDLENVVPGESYTLVCAGKGANTGRAQGGADVTLTETAEGGTRLDYAVTAQVEGRLARLGSRLIDTFAKAMADRFFEKFQAVVEGTPVPVPGARRWFSRVVGRGE